MFETISCSASIFYEKALVVSETNKPIRSRGEVCPSWDDVATSVSYLPGGLLLFRFLSARLSRWALRARLLLRWRTSSGTW